MRFRVRFFALAFVSSAALGVAPGLAQSAAPAPAATIALEQQVPLDPAITAGRFSNGVRYFIRTTKRPEKRAELRLIVEVGSIVEEPDQLGLAHFVEHMAFNGTKHFPKQETVSFLESLGMRFGPSINASTSFDETTYMLQLPTEKPEVLDRAFLILEDWAHGLTFDPVEIDKERGVVKEEWRVRRGAGARMQDKQLPILLKGSRYAERIPIGTVDVIDNFRHDRLIQFYRDWYRPDLMTVIAVGDFDPAVVERMIKAHFERIPAAKSPRPRPAYGVPDHPGTLYAIATDPEAPTASISIYSKMPTRDQRTVGAYRQQIVERLFAAMLGGRFTDQAQKPDAPFVGASASRSQFLGDKDVSTLSALVKGDAIERTLAVLFTEAERVARFGFTKGELERVKINLLAALERAVKEKDNTPAASIAGELVRHVTSNEPVPGIVYELGLYRRFMPTISLEELNALARTWVPDGNRVITVSAPQKPEFRIPTEAQLALVASTVLARKDIRAYVDTVAEAPLLDPIPSPGKIVRTETRKEYGITEWELANGVKVVLKPTQFRQDEILFRAASFGGTSLAPDEDYVPASSASAVATVGGLGKLSTIELRRKLTGKSASANAVIGPYEESVSGSSTRNDLETMFQLIHLRFTQPRADPAAFRVLQGTMKSSLPQQQSTPAALFNQAVTSALRGDHLRTRPVTVENVEQMNLEKSIAFYKDRFGDAGDFTFVFVGSFELADMRPLVERYLASLPSKGRRESWKDTGIRYTKGVVEKRVEKGLEPQSRAAIYFTGQFVNDKDQRIAIRALSEVLRSRLHEALREDLGGTYGVSAAANYSLIPVEEYAVNITFSCAPERTSELVNAAMQQIEMLKAKGPTGKEVTDTREKLLRDFETSSKQNAYWVGQLSLRYQFDEPLDSLFEVPELIKRIDAKMIHDAAKLYLNPENHVKVTLFPEKKS
jgi:zinc protease